MYSKFFFFFQKQIKYEKECRKIVDVLCGDHTHEDQEVAEDGHSHEGEEATEDTAIAGARKETRMKH